MYRSKTFTRRFDQDNKNDLDDYADIVNNPLAMIISENMEKLSERQFEEGRLVDLHERMVKVVTWQERSLL